MRSLPGFVRRHPELRASMGLGFISFSTFGGLWTVLAFHARDIGYGADVVGEVGLVSVVGAVFAARAGALADRRGTLVTGTIAWLFLLASYGVFFVFGDSIVGVLLGAALMAIGTQQTQISNQTRIFALDGAARSRLNTIYMFANFSGAALGSFAAAWLFQASGWQTYCVVTLIEVAAMGGFLWWYRGMGPRTAVRFSPDARSS